MRRHNRLYHYCPTPTFFNIVQSKEIWLSALSQSNDSMEGRVMREVFKRMALADGLGQKEIERIDEAFSIEDTLFEGLALCLSAKGDLLSQWRGYADDGTGVAVGFSEPFLRNVLIDGLGFPVQLQKIEYKSIRHEALLRAEYKALRKGLEGGSLDFMDAYTGPPQDALPIANSEYMASNYNSQQTLASLANSVISKQFRMKNKAFSEEMEWRLVSIAGPAASHCHYRSSGQQIIPYRKLNISYNSEVPDMLPIYEVVLGPKHRTPESVIRRFLEENGFPRVRVYRSAATYR